MLVSYNNNPNEFMNCFSPNGRPVARTMDLVVNLIKALKYKKRVEFLDDKYTFSNGTILDIFVSPIISNIRTYFFVISYMEDGETKYFTSPYMYDDTVEYNDLNPDKYYLLTHLDNEEEKRYRITIFN